MPGNFWGEWTAMGGTFRYSNPTRCDISKPPLHTPGSPAVTLAPRTAALLLIAVATLLRLALAAVLPALTDEAYHWQFTVHPDLSYFDHPPMTMLVAKLGLFLCGGWVHPFSLRLGFVLLCAGTTWFLFRWTARFFGDRAGVWAALGFSVSHHLTTFGGSFAVPDSPHFFFAVLTWWQVSEAVFPRDPIRTQLGRWLLVGLALGGALLSKYHGVLLPAGVVLYAAVTPGARRLLWSPGPYLAVAVGFAVFSPVLYWNATHEWASFKFQGGRMAGGGGSPLAHGGPLVWLIGPVVFLYPWIWFWLSGEFVRRAARFGRVAGVERLLVCLAVMPLAFFFANSCLTGQVLPHWPLIGFVPLFPLAGARWVGIRARIPRWGLAMGASWVVACLALQGALLAQAYTGFVPVHRLGIVDETKMFSGWGSVKRRLEELGIPDEPGVFLTTNLWENSGQLAFAFRNRIPVTCYHSFDARGFAFWSRPTDYVGRTGYLVAVEEADAAAPIREFGPFFTHMELVDEFAMDRGGTPFRNVKVYRCVNQRQPYPFDFTARGK